MTEQFKDPSFQSKEEENLEEKLKGRYMIERLKEGEWAQCDSDECFEEAGWFVEGFNYCSKHKNSVLEALRKADTKRHKEPEKELKNFLRPSNLLEAFGLPSGPKLTEEEIEMRKLLSEEYRNRKTSLVEEARKWRMLHPDATFRDAIRALYKKIEEEPKKNTGPQEIIEEGESNMPGKEENKP